MRLPERSSPSALIRLLSNVKNPLVILLTALGVVSFLTGDQRATVVIFVMVLLGVVLRFVQEMRADHAAEQLKAMVSNTATVVRDGQESELSLKLLVPGDIVRLAAGDMVPADVRVLSAKDLFVNQAALTGEALPVEKRAEPAPRRRSESLGTARISVSWVPTSRAERRQRSSSTREMRPTSGRWRRALSGNASSPASTRASMPSRG